jgi:hypothetical protein
MKKTIRIVTTLYKISGLRFRFDDEYWQDISRILKIFTEIRKTFDGEQLHFHCHGVCH